MTNTAVRWWVRMYARWMARVKGVQGQLSLLFQGMSGVGIASGAMKYLGAPLWAIGVFGVLFCAFLIWYIYTFSEEGVWNQVQRDRRDLSNNFAGPNGYIVSRIKAKAFVAGMQGEELSPEQEQAIEEVARKEFEQLRDGVELE